MGVPGLDLLGEGNVAGDVLVDAQQAAGDHEDHDAAQGEENAPLRAEQCRHDGDKAQPAEDKRDPLEGLFGVVGGPQLDDCSCTQTRGQQQQKDAQPLQDHITAHCASR